MNLSTYNPKLGIKIQDISAKTIKQIHTSILGRPIRPTFNPIVILLGQNHGIKSGHELKKVVHANFF